MGDHHCPVQGSASDHIYKPFYKICQNVLNWLYGWLEFKVEMEEEYIISKALLFAYVTHPDQVATLWHANCEKLSILSENMWCLTN